MQVRVWIQHQIIHESIRMVRITMATIIVRALRIILAWVFHHRMCMVAIKSIRIRYLAIQIDSRKPINHGIICPYFHQIQHLVNHRLNSRFIQLHKRHKIHIHIHIHRISNIYPVVLIRIQMYLVIHRPVLYHNTIIFIHHVVQHVRPAFSINFLMGHLVEDEVPVQQHFIHQNDMHRSLSFLVFVIFCLGSY